ncbi:unnamed protein product [Rhizoctonia solani]|uniref:MYND-type domain-containing protein n=1 Tax=Rhizoctonia solani TaxID=456999 RepID=A0A8H3CTY1_9AGAM|nr:unnamed protein product [Rhizoctonia solani]
MLQRSHRHPRWGQPLAQYTFSHSEDASRGQLYRREFEPIALEAIQQVCRLAGDGSTVSKQDIEQVPLTTLNTILVLSQSPLYLRHFESPSLISGCIKLMASVQVAGKPSPFSYEYGYLCFKIITLAVGVCILARRYELAETITEMIADQETVLLDILSRSVSQVVAEETEEAYGNDPACDWILGWVKAPDRPQQPPLASRADIMNLLIILEGDRKAFLKAISSTVTPGLSGVMFMLWRHVHAKCISKTHSRPESLVVPFSELLWRCMLASTKDEVTALMYMFNDMEAVSELWDKHSKRYDEEDSINILNIYIMRLAPMNLRRYSRLASVEMTAILRFIKWTVEPGCEVLFPRVFSMTLDRAWEAVEGKEVDDGILVDAVGRTLVYLGDFLQLLEHMLPISGPDAKDVMMVLIEKGSLDLIGQTMLLMMPTRVPPGQSTETGRNTVFLGFVEMLYEKLEKLLPIYALAGEFRVYIPEWLKLHRHFISLRYRTENETRTKWDHFRMCGASWRHMAKTLGLESKIKAILESGKRCSYSRCAAPDDLAGGELTCPLCLEPTYCSAQCQARDWKFNFGSGSHKQLCKHSNLIH